MSEPSGGRPSAAVEVTDEMAARFRDTLLEHANDRESGVCVRAVETAVTSGAGRTSDWSSPVASMTCPAFGPVPRSWEARG